MVSLPFEDGGGRIATKADPASEMEPSHLVRSRPADRPADVLSAAPGRLSALDIGITSAVVSTFRSEDPAELMWKRKTREREPIRQELEEIGTVYTPIVWTHHGRPHASAENVVKAIAKAANRRSGGSVNLIERAFRERIGIAIARRAARMSLATFTRGGSRHAEEEVDEDERMDGAWKELPPVTCDWNLEAQYPKRVVTLGDFIATKPQVPPLPRWQ